MERSGLLLHFTEFHETLVKNYEALIFITLIVHSLLFIFKLINSTFFNARIINIRMIKT